MESSRRLPMREAVSVALWAYLVPLTSARALRIGFFLALGFLGLVGLAVLLRPVAETMSALSLERLREGAVLPGVPITALLLSEIPVRDGIRHRTLLYPLLGPVSRPVLSATRTVATALLAALGLSLLILVVQAVEGGEASVLGRELLAVVLGSAAYVSLFGILHLISGRGLIAGLAVYGLFDDPLGRLPFSLRNLSPSYHVRVLADQVTEIRLPVEVTVPEPSFLGSATFLIAAAALLTALGAYLFSRKQLGEIC
jgi:hypothetical protein